MSDEDWRFDGFRSPHYTMVPDEAIDLLMARLTGAEFKVLMYIIRRTFGFKRDADAISLAQITRGIARRDGTPLDAGTGLSVSTAQLALKSLAEKGIIVIEKQSDRAGGDRPTVYRLRLVDPPAENRQRGVPEIGATPYRKSATQETEQHTDLDQGPVDPTEGMDDLARRRYWAEHAK